VSHNTVIGTPTETHPRFKRIRKELKHYPVQRGTEDSLTGFCYWRIVGSFVVMVTTSHSLPRKKNRINQPECGGKEGELFRTPWVAELKGQNIWQQN